VIARAIKLVLRATGWLLTPIAVLATAALGATIAAMVAPRLSPTAGVVVAGIGGLIGATLGLWWWTRLLRQSPELRDVLAMTPEGVPTEKAMTEVLGNDPPPSPPE